MTTRSYLAQGLLRAAAMLTCLVVVTWASPCHGEATDGDSGCNEYFGTTACVDPGPGGIDVGVGVGGVDGGPGGGSGGTGVSAGPAYEYAWILTCTYNGPDASNIPCVGATSSCGVPGQLRFWLYRRPIDAQGRPTGNWLRLPGTFCRDSGVAGAPVLTATDLLQAFRWRFVPIAASNTRFDPEDGTLVNVDTIFYADTPDELHPTVTLLGQRVQLSLHPVRWQWNFGDGTTLTTTTRGAPYPSTDVTHRYADPGDYRASVAVTWDGTFTFAGETIAIPGDTDRSGPSSAVTVREAHAHLVS